MKMITSLDIGVRTEELGIIIEFDVAIVISVATCGVASSKKVTLGLHNEDDFAEMCRMIGRCGSALRSVVVRACPPYSDCMWDVLGCVAFGRLEVSHSSLIDGALMKRTDVRQIDVLSAERGPYDDDYDAPIELPRGVRAVLRIRRVAERPPGRAGGNGARRFAEALVAACVGSGVAVLWVDAWDGPEGDELRAWVMGRAPQARARAARAIQRRARHALSCPSAPLCRARLAREFGEMGMGAVH